MKFWNPQSMEIHRHLFLLSLSLCAPPLAAQVTVEDYKSLKINEILASNGSILPQNCRCRNVDMIEIYNSSAMTALPLDNIQLKVWVRLTDHSVDPITGITRYLSFRGHPVRSILPRQRVVLFSGGADSGGVDCDDRSDACKVIREQIDLGEIDLPFGLDRDGEVLTLELFHKGAGENDPDAVTLLDEVYYPPMPRDVSYGRYPDGSDTWVFSKQPSFGACARPNPVGWPSCGGGKNNPGDLIEPTIELYDYPGNNPSPGAPLTLRALVADEKGPDLPNIALVEIRYHVDGGDEAKAPMAFKSHEQDPRNPIDQWSIWEGNIPGQPAGAVVEFHFYVQDADGLQGTDPSTDPPGTPGGTTFCPPGVGPCHRKDTPPWLGPNCVLGQDCKPLYRYTARSSYSGSLAINEVFPNNETLLEDPTEKIRPCFVDEPLCRFDEFIEIYNASDALVPLEGFSLSNDAFKPRGWTFPSGSFINPWERLIVWIDGDGRDPQTIEDPPNPNDPAREEFHTDFGINPTSAGIYLFDTAQNNFQLIDGARWGKPSQTDQLAPLDRDPGTGLLASLPADASLSRCPDGKRDGRWVLLARPETTPHLPNECGDNTVFKRGDANRDGGVDISDGIKILTFLFQGDQDFGCPDADDADDSGEVDVSDAISLLVFLFLGSGAPPADPGRLSCGIDPTRDDRLEDCQYPLDRC